MRSGWGLGALLLLSLAGCRDFPTVEANVCGNGVIEAGEDCDTFTRDANTPGAICRPKGVVGECHWDCTVSEEDSARGVCLSNWGCGADGLCHPAVVDNQFGISAYEAGSVPISSDLSSWLTTADFDGDGRQDLISTEPADQAQQARFRLHYFDDSSALVETRTFPRVTTRPLVYRPPGEEQSDLIFSNFRIGMLPGRPDRGWVPAAFSSYQVQNTGLRVVNLLDELVGGQTVLATFTTLKDVRAIYVPRPDGSQLDPKLKLMRPIDEIVADPLSADVFPGSDSPCKEVIYAYRGENVAHVVDLCRLGTDRLDPEITFRDEPRELLVRLPEGLGIDAAPVVADLEGDGDLDLLLGSGDSTYVAYGDGATLADAVGPLELHALDQKEPYRLPPPLAAGDLTGDDLADFVIPSGVLASHRSLVDGKVAYGSSYANQEQPWTTAEVVDLNGNDLPDVVAASQGAPGITLLNGTGSYYPVAARLSTRGDVRLLTTGDVDGDLLKDVAFLEAGAGDKPDGLVIAFGRRDQLPLSSTRIAELHGGQQLGHTRDVGFDSLFLAATQDVDGVQQSSLTLWDGSPDRLPFAPYTLVPFATDMGLHSSAALNVVVGGFTRPGAGDAVALGVERPTSTDYTLWLVPDITGVKQPPRQLDFERVEGVQPTTPISATAFKLNLATLAADLDGDGLDEVVALMPANGNDCALVSYDIDLEVEPARANIHSGPLFLGEPCPAPELGWRHNEISGNALILLSGDPQAPGGRRLSLLWDLDSGFHAESRTFLASGDQDVRAFATFSGQDTRIAFVTPQGLSIANSRGESRDLADVREMLEFTDARSVAVIDVNLDRLDDLVVADAEGLWLVQAELE